MASSHVEEETEPKKYLLIFDFDETLVDQDSEYGIANMILSKEEYHKIVEWDKIDYYDTFNYFFKRLKEMGLTLEDYDKYLEKLELSPGMKELFNYLRQNKSKYEMIILSGDIDYSIKHILKYHGFLDLFDHFILNRCQIQPETSERLIFVPRDQFPHKCNLCISSQCKGLELKKYLEEKGEKYNKIIFVCDGGNDFCPSKKILRKGDIIFPRVEHGLCKKLFEQNLRNELVCDVYPWKSADEIISKLKEI